MASRRDLLRSGGAVGLGISALALPAASAAASGALSGAPEGAALVTTTSGDWFDAWTERSGVTTSDRDPTNSICWQLFLAHRPLTIASGTVEAYGMATYANGSNAWTWSASVSTTPGTIGDFDTPVTVSTRGGGAYVAGGLSPSTASATLSVPAGHHFLIGVKDGPFYRAFRTLAASRTAIIGGVAQVTAVNRVYYAPHASSDQAVQLPSQVGGPGTFFTQLDGYAAVLSIRPTYG